MKARWEIDADKKKLENGKCLRKKWAKCERKYTVRKKVDLKTGYDL